MPYVIDETTKQKFNQLSPEEAKRLAELCDGQMPALRSCGYCNAAQEHLMEEGDLVRCFACGILYVSGYPAPAIGARMRGEELTDEDMAKFREALESAERWRSPARHQPRG
jgi:hypothetical protein